MSGARDATLGLVLSTTTDRPDASDSAISCSCLRCGFRLLRSRSLLTWSWVPARRSRKNVDLPDAGKPIRITHSIGRAARYRHLTMTFEEWLGALERRHLANLRLPEVTRALRALSSAYVERRHTVSRGGPLDSAGKRAAFALYYAPLHFLTTAHVIASLQGATDPAPSSILDIGCGTGAAGAAWALACG